MRIWQLMVKKLVLSLKEMYMSQTTEQDTYGPTVQMICSGSIAHANQGFSLGFGLLCWHIDRPSIESKSPFRLDTLIIILFAML
jgi:hypothetical protein